MRPVRCDHHSGADRQVARLQPPPPGRRRDHPGPRGRRRPAHRVVQRTHGVGAARELVEEQFGPGVVELDADPVEGGVELLGDQHGHGGGEALADLLAGQPEQDTAVLVDAQHEHVRGGLPGQDQQIAQIHEIGRCGRGGDRRVGAAGRADVDADLGGYGEGGRGHQVGEKPAPGMTCHGGLRSAARRLCRAVHPSVTWGYFSVRHFHRITMSRRVTTPQRAASACSPALRMASTGAGLRPVICSTWSTAWCTSRSRPLTTAPPIIDQRAASSVGQGS
ncbi:hypothetical protein RKD46_007040 [Streptomyces pseudovenezuelae]